MGFRAKWLVVVAGLLATGCPAAFGAGAAAVVIGAGALAFTCYDRVSVTVTDRLTGTKLCDAKVTFIEGSSETVASSCYQAALSTGKYTLRVERSGLATFEQPIEVVKGSDCGQTIQTMYVALDRANRVQPPQQVAPPAPASATPAPAAPPPAPVAAPAGSVAAPPAAVAAPSAAALTPAPAPSSAPTPAPSRTVAAPPATSFPDAK